VIMRMNEPVLSSAAFESLARPLPVTLAAKRVLVLGLGDTGLSVAGWVAREGGLARVAQAPHQLLQVRRRQGD